MCKDGTQGRTSLPGAGRARCDLLDDPAPYRWFEDRAGPWPLVSLKFDLFFMVSGVPFLRTPPALSCPPSGDLVRK